MSDQDDYPPLVFCLDPLPVRLSVFYLGVGYPDLDEFTPVTRADPARSVDLLLPCPMADPCSAPIELKDELLTSFTEVVAGEPLALDQESAALSKSQLQVENN